MPNQNIPGQVKKFLDDVVEVEAYLTGFACLTGDGKLWFCDPNTGLFPFTQDQPSSFRKFAVNDRVNILAIADDGTVWAWDAVDPNGLRAWRKASVEKH